MVVKSPSLAVKPSSLVSSSPWPEAVEVSGHPQLRAGDAFRVAFALAAQLPQTHFLPAVPSLGLCILSFVLDLRRSPAAPSSAGCGPCSSSAPHNPVSVPAQGACRHSGFSDLQKGSRLCCHPQPHLQLSPSTPQPYRCAQKSEEPLGSRGQECRVTFSPARVTWLGSRAQGGEVAKFTPCFPGWLGHPPGSLPGEQTGKQQRLGACRGRLWGRGGNRSPQTHLDVVGAASWACPPPGTPLRAGQLGTRQDTSAKRGSLLTGNIPPPSPPSPSLRPAGGRPARGGRK